jgi:hypothetical protein
MSVRLTFATAATGMLYEAGAEVMETQSLMSADLHLHCCDDALPRRNLTFTATEVAVVNTYIG